VLHVVPYYPPFRLGGVGEYAARLHRALLAAGHESVVLTRGAAGERGEGSPGTDDGQPQAAPPQPLDAGVECVAATRFGWFLRSALQSSRAAGFDVVHVHAGEALPLLLALAVRRRRRLH